jgi:hypothetical protein
MSKDNPTGKDLIAWVKQAQEKGGWVVLLFHGVGGDYLPVSLEAHKELLAYLAKNKKTIWTGTFGEVAGYLKKEEKKN